MHFRGCNSMISHVTEKSYVFVIIVIIIIYVTVTIVQLGSFIVTIDCEYLYPFNKQNIGNLAPERLLNCPVETLDRNTGESVNVFYIVFRNIT